MSRACQLCQGEGTRWAERGGLQAGLFEPRKARAGSAGSDLDLPRDGGGGTRSRAPNPFGTPLSHNHRASAPARHGHLTSELWAAPGRGHRNCGAAVGRGPGPGPGDPVPPALWIVLAAGSGRGAVWSPAAGAQRNRKEAAHRRLFEMYIV